MQTDDYDRFEDFIFAQLSSYDLTSEIRAVRKDKDNMRSNAIRGIDSIITKIVKKEKERLQNQGMLEGRANNISDYFERFIKTGSRTPRKIRNIQFTIQTEDLLDEKTITIGDAIDDKIRDIQSIRQHINDKEQAQKVIRANEGENVEVIIRELNKLNLPEGVLSDLTPQIRRASKRKIQDNVNKISYQNESDKTNFQKLLRQINSGKTSKELPKRQQLQKEIKDPFLLLRTVEILEARKNVLRANGEKVPKQQQSVTTNIKIGKIKKSISDKTKEEAVEQIREKLEAQAENVYGEKNWFKNKYPVKFLNVALTPEEKLIWKATH